MPDIADQAQSETDLHLKAALATRQQTVPCTGRCNWCSKPLQTKRPFCDAECNSDWHQHRRMNGGW